MRCEASAPTLYLELAIGDDKIVAWLKVKLDYSFFVLSTLLYHDYLFLLGQSCYGPKTKEKTNKEETEARRGGIENLIDCCLESAVIDAGLGKNQVNTATMKLQTVLSEDERITEACSNVAWIHLEHV